jgi:hypothetical protein
MSVALACHVKVFTVLVGGLIGGLADQLRTPRPPEVLRKEMADCLLRCWKRELESTIKLRERLEKSPKSNKDFVVELKQWEAEYRMKIDRMEKGQFSTPSPRMPLRSPNDSKP